MPQTRKHCKKKQAGCFRQNLEVFFMLSLQYSAGAHMGSTVIGEAQGFKSELKMTPTHCWMKVVRPYNL